MNFHEYQVEVWKQHPNLTHISLPPEELANRLHLMQRTLYDLALQAETLDFPLASVARLSLNLKDHQP
jgi:hypothetical protein